MAPAQPELKKVRILHMEIFQYPSDHRDRDERASNCMSANYDLQYLDKRLFVQLNGSRKVIGVLRGYDVCRSKLALALCRALLMVDRRFS